MTKRKNVSAAVPENGTVLFIPLNKLKKSPRNARKTPHAKADIEALAASIAANGMLQNPVVEPEVKDGKPTGNYLTTIGEGRRQAQLLRVKRKEITKGEPVRCMIETAHNALEISLAENAIRSPMHPADQFEAFFELHRDHGMNAEDIAARFGVTAAVVRQRLKLAAISPKLIDLYRNEEMTLDQLTAFAISDDHARQEAVWEEFGAEYEREDILAALNGEHVPSDDARARFVGVEAYQEAGGVLIRDLFDEEQGGFLTDPALLDRLAREKLASVADTVSKEGWKWVGVAPRYDHSATADMRRIYPEAAPLSEADQEAIAALEAEQEALDWESGDQHEEYDRLEDAIMAVRGEEVYQPDDIARAGAYVCIGTNGEPRIERGFIRAEDDSRPGKQAKVPKVAREEGEPAPLSEKLVAELTAHRTLALRFALGNAPELALTALVHALAAATFFSHDGKLSCVRVTPQSLYLGGHASGIADTPVAARIEERHRQWAEKMPEDSTGLWEFVRNMQPGQQLALLAHCVGLTVDAVKIPKSCNPAAESHADALSHALGFDMAAVWTPTTANYLGRVSKDRILEAVREGVSKEAADNLASLKKHAMAEAAEQRLSGKGWLPPLLRVPVAPVSQEAA